MSASLDFVGRITAKSDSGDQQTKVFDGNLVAGVTRQVRLLDAILAKSTANSLVAMGGITTGKALVITTDRPISIRLNAADGTLIPVDQTFVLIGTFTALYLTNADTAHDACVDILIAGA